VTAPAVPPLRDFEPSPGLRVGIVLELQVVNQHDHDLTPGAPDLLRLLSRQTLPGSLLPDADDCQVALSIAPCAGHAELLDHLRSMRDAVVRATDTLGLGVAGGGTHPFHDRRRRSGLRRPRLAPLSALYGELSRHLMVFGLQVHLGCADGDEALRLMQGLGPWVPHLVALSASSPFLLGHDSGFDSARLSGVSALPTAGRAPRLTTWPALRRHVARLAATGVVHDMQDCLWDIRPRPTRGTLELRMMDAPLSIEKAAALAAVAQCLARRVLHGPPGGPADEPPSGVADDDLAYDLNRFQACRFGLDGLHVDAGSGESRVLREGLDQLFSEIAPHAAELQADNAIRLLRAELSGLGNDAALLRRTQHQERFLPEVVRQQVQRWAGRP
jgi:glutamate---cysteine ligase / carboxylate-amine ligase